LDARVLPLLIHLRLHFQLLLSPIFLWGYLLAGGSPDGRFWLAFVALHIFLYGGTTAYNSYYDRDEGPIGGLENPPPITPELLPFSLAFQAIGAVLALFVNLTFFLLYAAIFVLFTAYSHPGPRLKGRPIIGLLTVALGQGVIAGLCGAAAADPTLTSLNALEWIGLLAAALLITGFYPITQIYQVEEDLERGDVTFAAWAGQRGTFVYALVTMSVTLVVLVTAFYQMFGGVQTLLLAAFSGLLLAMIARWAWTFDPAAVLGNYRQVMRLYRLMTLGFAGFICLHLFGLL
jgi:1,4-dihydroxy-2-naphthoate octaprenyltransferase